MIVRVVVALQSIRLYAKLLDLGKQLRTVAVACEVGGAALLRLPLADLDELSASGHVVTKARGRLAVVQTYAYEDTHRDPVGEAAVGFVT